MAQQEGTAAKSDEQIERERAAVAAMSNAKANMTATLDRIQTLERALLNAKSSISSLKGYIAPNTYTYGSNGKTCVSVADDAIAAIAKVIA